MHHFSFKASSPFQSFIYLKNLLLPNGILVFLALLSNVINIACQDSVRYNFAVDMQNTIVCGLLLPVNNDLVVLRGSFNGWSGNSYLLEDDNGDGIYRQSFSINIASDTPVEYKYLIIKADGNELWENQPNKNNMSYGNRILDINDTSIAEFDINRYHLGITGKEVIFPVEELHQDFIQFRNTLEKEHCCLYEYASRKEFDSLFDAQYQQLNRAMTPIEFFKVLTPVTAKIGCGHTAVWMPNDFWNIGRNKLFPLKIRLIGDSVVIDTSYEGTCPVKKGSILQEINGTPLADIIGEIHVNYSADAMNPYFIDSQIERRFSMLYARRFGFCDSFRIRYTPPNIKVTTDTVLSPAILDAVRRIVFRNHNHPPLQMGIIRNKTAVLTIPTFIYYDRVKYFTEFIDSCFALIHDQDIRYLILDLRGNDGGDPFCSAPLFSYLQSIPEPYFAERYGKYNELADPIPLPENHFTGNLFTLVDGACFSTNGHFCSLLKYHRIGKFVGTPTGATYTCNAGKNLVQNLDNTDIMVYFGRSSFATAVKGMDKTKPILPDYLIEQTLDNFISGRDAAMDFVLTLIDSSNTH